MPTNTFLVAVRGEDELIVLSPPLKPITADEALNLAAWLVALIDDGPRRFEVVLHEVQAT